MKNIILIIAVIAISLSVSAQNKTVKTSFKVYGNCGMCKERIEVALDTKGIKEVEWDVDTKMLQIVYDSSKISMQQIHQKITAVGHDTESDKAPDSIYVNLPKCCLFRDNKNTHHD
ncbi:MAG: cation transporter [Bacteroidetes bacterium]|nr:cation transporter [Bacteroidota bacterium]